MMPAYRIPIRLLLLSGYAVSLLLSSVQVLPHTSLPFVFSIAFLGYKLHEVLTRRRWIRIKPEGAAMAILYLYLVMAEQFLHKGTILNTYYISFGLNCVMLLLLADEFYRDSVVREKVMRSYVVAAVAVAMFVTLDIMTTASQTGRLTFLGQNQNELAAALLIAYCGLSTEFMRAGWALAGVRPILLLSAVVVLNALVASGTRFAIGSVITVLLLLVLAAMRDRGKARRAMIYVAVSSGFLAYKVLNFSPTLERVLPAVEGNNLNDLGGRTPLWVDALDAFKTSPLTGLGYDGYQNFILMREKLFGLPHNFPLELAAIAGAAGIVLVTVVGLILLWRVFVSGDRMNLPDALIWGVPVLIIMLMLNITHLKIFWFVLAYFMTLDLGTRSGGCKEMRPSE